MWMAKFHTKHNKMKNKLSFIEKAELMIVMHCSMHFYEIMKTCMFTPNKWPESGNMPSKSL